MKKEHSSTPSRNDLEQELEIERLRSELEEMKKDEQIEREIADKTIPEPGDDAPWNEVCLRYWQEREVAKRNRSSGDDRLFP